MFRMDKWPLLEACSNGHVEIAEALINAGADAEKWHLVCTTFLYQMVHIILEFVGRRASVRSVFQWPCRNCRTFTPR